MSLAVTAERDDTGEVLAAQRVEDGTRRSVGLLNLPDELIVYIFDLFFAASAGVGPPDYKLRLAEVKISSRIFRLARLALFREVTVRQPSVQNTFPPILAFLARQSQPLAQTKILRLQLQGVTGPILTAMIPRLFPNLATVEVFTSTLRPQILPQHLSTALSQCPQLRRLRLLNISNIRDADFDVRKLPTLRTLDISYSTQVSGRLLRSGYGPALETLVMTLDDIPAGVSFPWLHLGRLDLRIRREEMLPHLNRVAEDLALLPSNHPCRLKLARLALHLPLPPYDANTAETDHNIVIRSSHALAVLLLSARIRSLHLTGITGWPEQACSPRRTQLEKLHLQWHDLRVETPAAHIPLPDIHRLLLQSPELNELHLDVHPMAEVLDGRWMLAQQATGPSPGEFAIYEPNLSSLIQYMRYTNILFFAFRPRMPPTDEPGIRELRWTRRSKEEDFAFSRWTIYKD